MLREKWNALALVAGVVVLAVGAPWLVEQIRTLPKPHALAARAEQRVVSLDVGGMTCKNCANAVKNTLARVDGVTEVQVRFAEHKAIIVCDAAVADSTLAWIQQHVDRLGPDAFVASTADRTALLRLLKPRPGLYARLSEMHDCGLLGRIFPEFQSIAWRVVRDFYHKYTVDEHTLLTIRGLERLAVPPTPSLARFGSLLSDLAAPELLVLALLCGCTFTV